jgi:hypothetical protein
VKKWRFILAAGLMVLTVLAAPVAAGTIRTEFEGTATYGETLDPGTEWISGGRILHIRGMEYTYGFDTTDARISGTMESTFGANWHLVDTPPFMYGPMWGTSRIDKDAGYWEGSWVGVRTKSDGFTYAQIVLRGHGGYEGLHARMYMLRENPDPYGPFQVHGVIMEPGGD